MANWYPKKSRLKESDNGDYYFERYAVEYDAALDLLRSQVEDGEHDCVICKGYAATEVEYGQPVCRCCALNIEESEEEKEHDTID